MPIPTGGPGRTGRRTLLGDLRRQGRHDECVRILSAAIVESRGVLTTASHLVDFRSKHNVYLWLDRYPALWALVNGQRALRKAAPKSLVRTLAALEAGAMSVLEQLIAAAEGMSAEEVAAEVAASQHGGSCDPQQLAEAIVGAAATG